MKTSFEKREKFILKGLLLILADKAQQEKMKKEYKFAKKLLDKFNGENLELNLKPDEIKTIKMIVDTVIKEGEAPTTEDGLPIMNNTDLETCRIIKAKLV